MSLRVNGNEQCRDEYDSYAATICRWLRDGVDVHKLTRHLSELQRVSMGMSVIDEELHRRVAQRLLKLVEGTERTMSSNANQPVTRQRVIVALSRLIGLPLTASRRAADMRTFQFGQLRPVERGSVGDFALHVQCPWRIEGPDGIVTGRLDLWEPVEENAPYDENWNYEKSPNLQDARMKQWLAQNELVVTNVDADEFGGAAISLSQGYVLRLFPAGTRGEDWRWLQPKSGARHLVIGGGAVELDEERDTTTGSS